MVNIINFLHVTGLPYRITRYFQDERETEIKTIEAIMNPAVIISHRHQS